MPQMLMGSDPEHFLLKDGKVVAAHSLGVPPRKEAWVFTGGLAYRDGFALELAPHPDECRAMFSNNLMTLYGEVLARVNGLEYTEFFLLSDEEKKALPVQLSLKPLHAFEEKEFISLMAEAPEDLKQFGCSPAYDAYNHGKAIRVRVRPAQWPFRTTGGHMHYTVWERWGKYGATRVRTLPEGFPEAVEAGKDVTARLLISPLVRRLDALVGLAYTALFPHEAEAQRIRRGVYGLPGEFRIQVYRRDEEKKPLQIGLEYRTLGPSLMASSHTVGLFYGLLREALEGRGVSMARLTSEKEVEVREAVMQADDVKAATLWNTLFPEGVTDHVTGRWLLTPMMLEALRKSHLEKLSLHTLPFEEDDAHDGWGEFVSRLGLPIVEVCSHCGTPIRGDGVRARGREGNVERIYHRENCLPYVQAVLQNNLIITGDTLWLAV